MTVLYKPDPVNYLQGSVCQRAGGSIFRHRRTNVTENTKEREGGRRQRVREWQGSDEKQRAALHKQWKKRGEKGKRNMGAIVTSQQRRAGKRKECIGEIYSGGAVQLYKQSVQKHRNVQTCLLSYFTPLWAFQQLPVIILSQQNRVTCSHSRL